MPFKYFFFILIFIYSCTKNKPNEPMNISDDDFTIKTENDTRLVRNINNIERNRISIILENIDTISCFNEWKKKVGHSLSLKNKKVFFRNVFEVIFYTNPISIKDYGLSETVPKTKEEKIKYNQIRRIISDSLRDIQDQYKHEIYSKEIFLSSFHYRPLPEFSTEEGHFFLTFSSAYKDMIVLTISTKDNHSNIMHKYLGELKILFCFDEEDKLILKHYCV